MQGPGLWVSTERGATESPIGMNSLEQFWWFMFLYGRMRFSFFFFFEKQKILGC